MNKVFFIDTPLPPPPEIVSVKKASKEELFVRLSYLSEHDIGGFARINPDQVTDAVFTAAKTKWKSLTSITKLDCGIDTTKI